MKNLLFIIDPIATLDFKNDASFLIMAEAKKRGHAVWISTADDLCATSSKPYVTATELTAIWGGEKKWKAGATKMLALENFDVILMRKDPPFNMDYIFATYVLSLVDPKKTFVLNNPSALRDFNEKMGIFEFREFIPSTIVSKKYTELKKFLEREKKIVLKPLDRSSGQEVIILDNADKNRNSLLEILTQKESRFIMAQRYLPAVKKGDKRIFILDGKILGAYNRIGHDSDYRSNLHSGGHAEKTALTVKERIACEQVALALKKKGIYLAGIDMIGGYITEINVTSPGGGFDLMNIGVKVKMEARVVDFLEAKASLI